VHDDCLIVGAFRCRKMREKRFGAGSNVERQVAMST